MSDKWTPETVVIRDERDVVLVRRTVRRWAQRMALSLVEETKLITAASEVARNALDHAGGGTFRLERVDEGPQRAVRLICVDEGPGIADVDRALEEGFSTSRGLGLGLSGARRLVSALEIESSPGRGTRVELIKWCC